MRSILTLVAISSFCLPASVADDMDPFLERVSLDVTDKPLIDCLRDVCQQAGVKFQVDTVALADVKIDLREPTTVSIGQVTLHTAMHQLVQFGGPRGLYRDWYDDTVWLTTQSAVSKRHREMTPDWLKNRPVTIEGNHITRISLRETDTDKFLKQVVTLPSLKEIDLGNGRGLTLNGLKLLATCASLRTVKMYSMGQPADDQATWSSDEALREIAGIRHLEVLHASDCGISDEGVAHLAALTRLKTLSLRQNRITDHGLKSLAKLTELRALYLGCYVKNSYGKNEITNVGLEHLSGLKNLKALGAEGLTINRFDIDLPQLQNLSLGSAFEDHLVSDNTLRSLQRYPLTRLSINSSTVSDEGIAALAEISTLTSLDLHCRRVTDVGIESLSTLPLVRLGLRRVELTGQGLGSIATIDTLVSLEIFGGMNRTSVADFQQLKVLPNLQGLQLTGFSGPGNYTGFGELKHLQHLFFESADLRNITQKDLNRLGELLPNARIGVGTGGGIYSPQRDGESGLTIPN